MMEGIERMDRADLLAYLAARLSVSTMQVAAGCCTEQLRQALADGHAQIEHYRALGYEDMAMAGADAG